MRKSRKLKLSIVTIIIIHFLAVCRVANPNKCVIVLNVQTDFAKKSAQEIKGGKTYENKL